MLEGQNLTISLATAGRIEEGNDLAFSNSAKSLYGIL